MFSSVNAQGQEEAEEEDICNNDEQLLQLTPHLYNIMLCIFVYQLYWKNQ